MYRKIHQKLQKVFGYNFEVETEYPEQLGLSHNVLPFPPENMKIKKQQKIF